jgi:hypothetical protein
MASWGIFTHSSMSVTMTLSFHLVDEHEPANKIRSINLRQQLAFNNRLLRLIFHGPARELLLPNVVLASAIFSA